MLHLFFSFLIGSTLQCIATGLFWLLACGTGLGVRSDRPQQTLHRFYGAELVKWAVVIVGFSGIWAWGVWDPLAVLVGFFIPQLIYWKLLFWRKSQKTCLNRKSAA